MFSATVTNKPVWFLMVLCALNVIYTILHKYVYVRHVVCVSLFGAAYFCVCNSINVPPVFNRIGLSVIFYWLGHLYNNQAKFRIEARKCFLLPLVITFFIASLFITGTDIYLLKINTNPVCFILAAMLGVFMTLSISHCLSELKCNGIVELLKTLGSNSLYIFAVHWPLLNMLQQCNIPNTVANLTAEFVLSLFVSLVFAIGAKRILNRFYQILV